MSSISRWNGSLFLRLALLVVLSVGASQAFTIWLFSTRHQEQASQNLNQQVSNTIDDLSHAMEGLSLKERKLFIENYNRLGGMQLLPMKDTRKVVFLPRLDLIGTKLHGQLNRGRHKKPVVVRLHKNGKKREIWVRTKLIDSEYWLVVPRTHFIPQQSTTLWLASIMAAIFAIFIAFIMAWRISRPLSSLALAAQLLQQGITPNKVKPRGPKEVAAFTEHFNKMASAIDSNTRERSLMLAGLSHDLRTPLTRLQLSVTLQAENTEREGMLDDINQLSRIVQQFIDFARSEESMRLETLQLAELIESVVARFSREKTNITIKKLAEPELTADALALERMLTNLIDNARRYGAEPISIILDEDANYAIITVYDSGKGIEKQQREAAFAPFERLLPHRGTDGGSGLGLAIVSRIVKQHRGKLSFIDPKPSGFGIRIHLPKNNE